MFGNILKTGKPENPKSSRIKVMNTGTLTVFDPLARASGPKSFFLKRIVCFLERIVREF